MGSFFFFICYLAVSRSILGHCRGGSLTNRMLITAFLLLILTRRSPYNEFLPWSLVEHLLGFEPGTFQFSMLISGFDLATRDSYFTILVDRNLAENTYFTNHMEWTEHRIMVLKPANKYQIIWHCHNLKNTLINNFQHHPFLYQAKVL